MALFNPVPLRDDNNFATLGVTIESMWQGQTVYKSGTSYATAVAAGIAANVLEYARQRPELVRTAGQVSLCSSYGMRAMFRLMSVK